MTRPIIFLLAILLSPTLSPAYELLFSRESPYHQVRVTEDGGYRFLSFDQTRGTQSAMKLNDPNYLEYTYTRLTFASLAFVPEPADVLFVGLGGASMPRFMRGHFPDINLDLAEIDPMVVEVAKKYFKLVEDPKMKVYNIDGRVFISRTKKKYDIIILDAYNARTIPFHLTTREFMEQVKAALKPDGVVVSNIWSPYLNEYFEAEIKTFQAVFPELYVFAATAGGSGNYIFIATNRKGEITRPQLVERAKKIDEAKKFHFSLADLVSSAYEYSTNRTSRGEILTDDHAPVDTLRSRQVR